MEVLPEFNVIGDGGLWINPSRGKGRKREALCGKPEDLPLVCFDDIWS